MQCTSVTGVEFGKPNESFINLEAKRINGYAHGTGDHLRHIVCIVCLDRFSRKKTIGSFKR